MESISLGLSALAVCVTIGLFVVTQLIAWQAREATRRARLVDLVLREVERAARVYGRPALVRVWSSPERDALLLLPRVLQQLGTSHGPVERWVTRQVAQLLREPQRAKVFEAQMNIAVALLAWDSGSRTDKWFKKELKSERGPVTLEVPKRVRRRRSRQIGRRMFGEALGVAAVMAVLGRVWRLL